MYLEVGLPYDTHVLNMRKLQLWQAVAKRRVITMKSGMFED
jgi:hypothetical protein